MVENTHVKKIKPKRKNHCIKLINTFCHYYQKKILIIEWKVQSYIKKVNK